MALGSIASRVKETWTGTGTGTINLAGASSGFQAFVSGLGTSTGDTTGPWTSVPYVILNPDVSTEWEMGLGTVTDASPDTLARNTVLDSSNGAALVNFSAGTKVVICGPTNAQFPRIIPVTMTLSADESFAAGATEDITGFTAALDPQSLVSSGQVTAPFDAYMQWGAIYLKDDQSGTTEGIAPNLKIDGTGDQIDYSGLSFTAPDASFTLSASHIFSVSKDDVIVPQGTNTDSDSSRDLEANSTVSFLFIERFV